MSHPTVMGYHRADNRRPGFVPSTSSEKTREKLVEAKAKDLAEMRIVAGNTKGIRDMFISKVVRSCRVIPSSEAKCSRMLGNECSQAKTSEIECDTKTFRTGAI